MHTPKSIHHTHTSQPGNQPTSHPAPLTPQPLLAYLGGGGGECFLYQLWGIIVCLSRMRIYLLNSDSIAVFLDVHFSISKMRTKSQKPLEMDETH